jgi:hypothetical protein
MLKGFCDLNLVLITDSKSLYFNVEDLFNQLGINIRTENNQNFLTGFIANEANTYKIDVQNSQILVGAKNIKYENGVVEISNSVYVESNL